MHFFLIYDENFHLLRSGDKKAAPSHGAAGGERIIWGENGKNRRDRKIGITQFELVTNCHRLTCFYPLRSTPFFVIRSVEFEKGCSISQTIVLPLSRDLASALGLNYPEIPDGCPLF